MTSCETLHLGSLVSSKYKSYKQEFRFDGGSDDVFVEFLLDISVKAVEMVKQIGPVFRPVLEASFQQTAMPTDCQSSSSNQPTASHQHQSDHQSTQIHHEPSSVNSHQQSSFMKKAPMVNDHNTSYQTSSLYSSTVPMYHNAAALARPLPASSNSLMATEREQNDDHVASVVEVASSANTDLINKGQIGPDSSASNGDSFDVVKVINPNRNPIFKAWNVQGRHSKGSSSNIVQPEARIKPYLRSSIRKMNNLSTHRPLFQNKSSNVSGIRKTSSNKYVRKLPNFVKPTASRQQQITKSSFINFKKNLYPADEGIKNTATDNQCDYSINSYRELSNSFTSQPVQEQHNQTSQSYPNTRNLTLLKPPTTDLGKLSQKSSKHPTLVQPASVDKLNMEFAKEIGNVLESLTEPCSSSNNSTESSFKRVSKDGTRALSMVGMVSIDEASAEERIEVENNERNEILGEDKGETSGLLNTEESRLQADVRKTIRHTRLNSRYKKYPDEMLKKAMISVQMGHRTVAQAAKEFNIPRQTLQYRLFKRKQKLGHGLRSSNYLIGDFQGRRKLRIEHCDDKLGTDSEYLTVDSDSVDVTSESIDNQPGSLNLSEQVVPPMKSERLDCEDVAIPDCTSLLNNMSGGDLLLSLERTVQELLSSDTSLCTDVDPPADGHVTLSTDAPMNPQVSS